MVVVGIDGCRGGWVAARVVLEKDNPADQVKIESFCKFEQIVDTYTEAAVLAVDIPIGLTECQRQADVEARAVLGDRKSSVFPAPDPRVVHLDDYWEANARMRELCGKGISKQAFAIFPKVREVNDVVRRRDPDQKKIIEIHPEVCFWALAGKRAMYFPKRNWEGYQERRRLLQSWLEFPIWSDPAAARTQAPGADADDVLDAIAAAWTAQWWEARLVGRFPLDPERDSFGLRAEIVY